MKLKFIKNFKDKILFVIKHEKIKSYFQTILNFVALGIAIYAVIIAQKTLDNSNDQFERNMISSDSLFNYQLKHSKQLNDSLIYQISELQKITNNQLQITDEQLKVSIQTLQEEKYSGRPKIIIEGSVIADTNMIINEEIFSPLIKTQYSNIGKRPALNFNYRSIVLYPDFTNYRIGEKQINNVVDPGESSVFNFAPKIAIAYKDNFYYCFEIEYLDEELGKQFYQAYYYHYYKSREGFNFFYCEREEAEKIRKTLNNILRKNGIELFDN